MVTGHAAWTLKLEKLRASKPTSLTPLKDFATWRHLLTDEQTREITKLRDALLQAAGTVSARSAKAKPVRASKKKLQSDEDLTSAALAMLRLPSKA